MALVREVSRVSPAHRRFLLLEQGFGAGVFNAAVNALIAWLSFRGTAVVPLWGQQSIGGDTIGTCFLLPLVTVLIATPVCRRRVRAGDLAPIAWTPMMRSVLGWLPTGTVRRGIVAGAVTTVVAAPAMLLGLRWFGVVAWPLATFIAYKAVFGGLLGAAVTPLVALAAIAAPTAPTSHA